MRLLADENIQAVTIRFLQGLGHDVIGVSQLGLAGMADEAVFRLAQTEGRVLLTFNMDFADLRDLAGKEHPGIIRLRVSDQRAAHLHPVLEGAIHHLALTDTKNGLVTVSDQRTRIRKTTSL
jgi:predicted nuclease of predicted toxin-antitoxin system